MGILAFIPHPTDTTLEHKKPKQQQRQHHHQSPKRHRKHQHQQSAQPTKPKQPSSWDQIKNLLTCKQVEGSRVHDPSKRLISNGAPPVSYSKLSSSCGSICSFRDVVHGNSSRVVHRSNNSSPESSSLGHEARLLGRRKTGFNHNGSVSSRSLSGSVRSAASATTTHSVSSSRGMPLRKLSGCYECHMIVDPSRYPIIPRSTVCACPHCGEIFPKIESLENHQAVRHAVSELGPDDSGRNIVEIIFKSSWLKKDKPICKIERILKVENTQRTIQRFEDCRDAVKLRANNNTKKNPRCAADGNELLRFHCTTLTCSLGAHGSSNLCGSVPACGVCTIIRNGFQGNKGVKTTASSGKAHDSIECTDGRRAMLVCRVIAGRVKRSANDEPVEEEFMSPDQTPTAGGASYDSVAGSAGLYSNLEDLIVYNPRAILPCFVVIYKTLAMAG